MISMIQTVPAGNALRIWVAPPVATPRIRLLRKETNDFTGWDDPDAYVVIDGPEKVVTDFDGLIDGSPVWYRAFYWINDAWVSSDPKQATSQTNFTPLIVDPLMIVRDRLELGLAKYVQNGSIRHPRGYIPVLTASPQIEDVPLPLVTIHLNNDSPQIRAIGEEVMPDSFDLADGLWHWAEGALSSTDLTIVAWSTNGDERLALRNAMKAVLIANLPIFDAAGLLQVGYSFTDVEDYETYSSPMFQALCTFNCFALSAVDSTDPGIRDVITALKE